MSDFHFVVRGALTGLVLMSFAFCGLVMAQTRLLEPRINADERDQRTAWAVQIESWITCPHQPRFHHYPLLVGYTRSTRCWPCYGGCPRPIWTGMRSPGGVSP